jgi:hypothetical protein
MFVQATQCLKDFCVKTVCVIFKLLGGKHSVLHDMTNRYSRLYESNLPYMRLTISTYLKYVCWITTDLREVLMCYVELI